MKVNEMRYLEVNYCRSEMNVRDKFERQALKVRICGIGRKEGDCGGERDMSTTASSSWVENSAAQTLLGDGWAVCRSLRLDEPDVVGTGLNPPAAVVSGTAATSLTSSKE